MAPSSAPSLPALFHAGSAPGVTLQSFAPLTQPYAVSSAVPLVAFQTPSGFFSARESATRPSGLDWNQARSSPGSFPLQGSILSVMTRPSPCLPSCSSRSQTQAAGNAPLQGFAHKERGASLSRSPALLGFVAF